MDVDSWITSDRGISNAEALLSAAVPLVFSLLNIFTFSSMSDIGDDDDEEDDESILVRDV